MLRLMSVALATLFSAIILNAQVTNGHCGSDEFTELLINSNPELIENYRAAREAINQAIDEASTTKKGTEAVLYTIPVVVHVIYDTPYDNIAKSQILDALRVLNEDYRRLNADAVNTRPIFQGRAADIEVEFALAKKDPSGNCTDGINRIQSNLSNNADDKVKDLIHWDNNRYLNIWVVSTINSSSANGTILGYAYRPYFGQNYKKDGILIRHDRMGTIGTGMGISLGRTLTHEVGHFLGLLHPFSDGCQNHGDGISDTPPVASATNGCPLNANTCHTESPDLLDMIENYMDYTDDACQNAFTQGQKNVMRGSLQTSGLRKELIEESNLNFTGITNPPDCAPTALFTVPKEVVCEGEDVQYLDETEDGDPSTYSWFLPGATPDTSSAINPIVKYNTPGVYNATLTVSNSAGNSTTTVTRAISVRPSWSAYNAEWRENFEAASLENTDLTTVSNYDTVGFRVTKLAASSGAQSLFLDNFNANEPKDVDVLYSPNIETLFGKNITLNFDYAYAQKVGNEIEVLRLYISIDCGKTWSVLRSLAAFTLKTANPTADPFVPTSSEWKTSSTGLSAYEDDGPILLRFEFRGAGGNNLYIDNINLTSSNIGLDETRLSNEVKLYPNPATHRIVLDFEDNLTSDATVSFTDLTGKVVLVKAIKKNTTSFVIDNFSLPAGVYVLSINSENLLTTKKLVIE